MTGIVFGTPMYGGQCTAEFFRSCMELRGALTVMGVDHQWLTNVNESLIPRARNTMVARFMRDPELKDYDIFMFIDADIDFGVDDVGKLWELITKVGHEVVCAAYPMKTENAWLSAWVDGKLTHVMDLVSKDGPIPCDYAGTGFLMMTRAALQKMQDAHPETRHMEGRLGEGDTAGECYALFDTEVTQDEDWKQRVYLSEDYLFCQRWRKLGGRIMLDPTIRLGHVGRKVYR